MSQNYLLAKMAYKVDMIKNAFQPKKNTSKTEQAISEDNDDYFSTHKKDCMCDECMTEGDRKHDEEKDNELQDEMIDMFGEGGSEEVKEYYKN